MFIKFILAAATAFASQFVYSQTCDFNRDFSWTGEAGTCTGRGSGVGAHTSVLGVGPAGATGSATYYCNAGQPWLFHGTCTPGE